MKRKPARPPPAPAPPRPPPEPPPAWAADYKREYRSCFDRWRTTTLRMRDFKAPVYLPPVQRVPKWTPQQQIDYCAAMMRGEPTGQILIVSAGWHTLRRNYVIDGQQRLTALGIDVVRHDGTRNPPTAARFNVHTGEWGGTEEEGSYSLAESAGSDFDMWRRADDVPVVGRARVRGLAELNRLTSDIDLPAYTANFYAPDEKAGREIVSAFASINHPGTPITPDDLAALLSFGEGWIPATGEVKP